MNEINLLYASSNTATHVAVIIKHCEPEVRTIAINLRTMKGPYSTVKEFLDDFRLQRFPRFHDDCRQAFVGLKQHYRETAVQFYFRFCYLLEALNRNVEEYWGDYIQKLAHSQVKAQVRFVEKKGRTVQDLASYTNEVENSLNVHKNKGWDSFDSSSKDEDDPDCYEISRGGKSGGRGGRGGRGGGRSGASESPKNLSYQGKTDLWGLERSVCWRCFRVHSTTDKPCVNDPCLFCKASDHLSIRCHDAPTSKEAFEEIFEQNQS